MYFCVGTFLTALKICKASSTKQKLLGEKVFLAVNPKFCSGDDDSAISAAFRGSRNINSFINLDVEDLDDPKTIAMRFESLVIPILDENMNSILVRLIQAIIDSDFIEGNTRVELVNNIKKKDLIRLNEVVLSEFLAGVFLYAIKNTDNLKKENEVKDFKKYVEKTDLYSFGEVTFASRYLSSEIFHDNLIRPLKELYNNSGTIIDVISANIFEVESKLHINTKANVVIPVNTTFETKLTERLGDRITELVSANTIHGQWIEYIKDKGIQISEIDKSIDNDLKCRGFRVCGVRGSSAGKQNVYPLSSIAIVKIDNIRYFLVALTEFDVFNKANTNISNVEKTIQTIIDYYDIEGQGDDLYIPLIGSGRSRSGLTLQESYELIKDSLDNRKKEIYGRVHIVIFPKQKDQISLEV